ncbi:hypothetical protein F3J16_06535 [Burkholderia sp. Ap-962]|uniref:hypothetical protein n=1 Tax=Burkholderia sp. Ap-962 TaxID=2608333 RepID=UPI0014200432|nr:hypothetical protein [Burkholderia sp. Ap-962]NIF69849.1 hypothetical protein [Burkholderia sp. Ap-962]
MSGMGGTRGAEETNERRGPGAGAMRIRRAAPGEEPALLAIFQSSVRGLASRDYTPAQIDAWAPPAAAPLPAGPLAGTPLND